ncbi:Gfo/Idh/MocA family protein [Terrabacter sp. MAHUQ-38]|uniref:Gfo/Idh/MocA family protein n=1 Tax=unclassified Terrabacter TaxID=2630222 RepID=UPI00165E1F66|nr:Gfo/Idh/MocA family oxidoreductase [Terrabacter sp. MAHUQ-38]MBC9820178.1 Gfo/Idh/MocA family oxidoreductase [Terrabacter sp. MAHUQ-38]
MTDQSGQSDLRMGIVGFGLRASLARYAHRPGEGSRVTVVCDTAERGRRDAAARIEGVRVVASLDEILAPHVRSEVDAVLVLTPDHVHAEHAVRTLEAGIPTFVEKPLATSIADADRILAAAHRTRTRLYVGHNMRHLPVVTAMREVIEAGTIGQVKAVWCRHFVSAGGDYYFKDWHADRRNTTGLLLQKGAHDIDVIHWLAGAYSRRVSAVGALAVYGAITDHRDNSDRRMADWYSLDNWPPTEQRELHPVVDVEDISMAHLVLEGGVLASYQQCHFTPDYWRNYTVIGTKGRLENFGDGPGAVVKVWTRRTDAYREDADEVIEVPAADTTGHGGADPLLVAEFVRFAREGGETMTSPVAAREAVAAGACATSSLRTGGGAVDVPALDPELVEWFEGGQVPEAAEEAGVAAGGGG